MVSMTNLGIYIGAEFRGLTAFNKANKQVTLLDKGVGLLSKRFLQLVAAQRLYGLGKESVSAFVADDKAARSLTQTISNLGLAFESQSASNFIKAMETQWHIADDQLRPAMAKLLQVTGSLSMSQKILSTAYDTSAGTGLDFSSTVDTLSQAYVGNLKGLKKFNTGLTNAELSTMSFQQVVEKLNKTFAGQGALASQTPAGQMDALNIAAGNAKETIGKGLVEALSLATGSSGDIKKLASSMQQLADTTASVVKFLGAAVHYLTWINVKSAGFFDKLFGIPKAKTPLTEERKNLEELIKANDKNAAARAASEAAALKRQRELAALAKKATKDAAALLALKKAQNVLDMSSKVMDIDLIQNAAALQGKITSDETKRLELQQAILMGNASAAGKLAQELAAAQVAALKAGNTDPFSSWTEGAKTALIALQSVRSGLAGLGVPSAPVPPPAGGAGGSGTKDLIGSIATNINYESVGGQALKNAMAQQAIKVEISMKDSATDFITATIIDNTANGNQNSLSRNFNYSSGL